MKHTEAECLNVLLTGYLFRNAQYRIELQRSIDEADGSALPARTEAADASDTLYAGWDGFADGSQTKHVQVRPVRHSHTPLCADNGRTMYPS